MKLLARWFVIVLMACGAGSVWAADHYVAHNGQVPNPPSYSTLIGAASNIQDAVNAAAKDDTVWIDQGTYTVPPNPYLPGTFGTNVVVFLTNMTLRSISGNPANTIIDGQGQYRCVWMGSGSAAQNGAYVLDGLTITNGYYQTVCAGVYIYNQNYLTKTAVVKNCVITRNNVWGMAAPDWGHAGGLVVDQQQNLPSTMSVLVSNCTFRNNSTNGMWVHTYSTNVFTVAVLDCLFENNTGSGLGLEGGAGAYSNLVNRCTFRGNASYGYGAGLYAASPTTLRNSLFTQNRYINPGASDYGGGSAIGCWDKVDIFNCTIVSNYCDLGGGALYGWSGSTVRFWNSIIYSNRDFVYGDQNGQLYGATAFTNTCRPDLVPGTAANNINAKPELMDYPSGNLRQWGYSPGVDSGLVQPWMTGETDLAGSPRVSANGRVDMGCYETTAESYPGHYVAQNGQTPVSPYTNLTTAVSNIQDAVVIAPSNATIWIGPGTYTVPPSLPFYAGTNVVYANRPVKLRGTSGNPVDTIIDGAGTNRGIAMVYGAGGVEFLVDGLTIRNCSAPTLGGGIMFYDNLQGYNGAGWTGRVQNCVIVTNTVVFGPAMANNYQGQGAFGGGIGMTTRSNSKLIVSNCVVRANLATNNAEGINIGGNGGGIYTYLYLSTATVSRCQLQNNVAYRGGNGNVGYLVIENSVISGGRVGYSGSQAFAGGLFINVPTTVRNCLFYDNDSWGGRGAAINLEDQGSNGVLNVENCTFVGNNLLGAYTIAIRDWAVANNYMPSLHMVNSIMYSNGAPLYLKASDIIPANYSSYASNCCISTTNASDIIFATTNMLYYKGYSTGTITNNPQFADYRTAVRNYRTASGSPCRNTGTALPWMLNGTALDLDNLQRLSEGAPDTGAYEYQPGGTFIFVR